MGNITTITDARGSVITVSMAKWGIVKRLNIKVLRRLKPRLVNPNLGQISTRCFVPKYEIALFDGPTTFCVMPLMVFYCADKETALAGWDRVTKTLSRSDFFSMKLHVLETMERKRLSYVDMSDGYFLAQLSKNLMGSAQEGRRA